MVTAMAMTGCGAAGGSPSGGSSPPTTTQTTVSVSPATASLFLGQTQSFTSTVTGNTNTAVNWSVNGITGGNAMVGTITASGLYTAPALLPSSTAITIQATSQADSSASGKASVTLESDVQVTISPSTASVAIGASQTFTAQVTGTGHPSTAVNWSLTGSACPTACGTLTTSGNSATYTAPAAVPSAPAVSIVATSLADPSKSATAAVTIVSGTTCTTPMSISPATASVALGVQQTFTANVCFSTNQNVTWSVTGSSCTTTNCGTVASTGANTATYTAPASLPPANPVTLVATSVADPSRTASASITVTSTGSCSTPVSLSPSAATVDLGAQQSFTASVCFTTNQSVSWSVQGSGCTGGACGTVSSTGTDTAIYTAPASLPPSNPITLVATSLADATKSASASIEVVSAVAVSLSPLASEVAVNREATLSPTVEGTTNQAVTWTVDGVTNGNATVGEICLAGSSPCAAPTAPVAGPVEYLAPASVPSPANVYVTATAAADTSRAATAEVGVVAHLSVQITPAAAVVAPSGTVEFAAVVTASPNTAVTWKISCSGTTCGTITASGVYTAPSSSPSPNAVTVTATSQDVPTQSASATVALTSNAAIAAIAPASATAGAAGGFTLAVTGYDFTATSPGPGTTLLVNGAPQTTTCASATSCAVAIASADVSSAGTVTIQAKNPDGTLSNVFPLIVVPADGPAGTISLSPSQPVGGLENVTAVQPTTDGTSIGPLTLLLFGLIDTSTNTCNVSESPIRLAAPSSGSAVYSICLEGNGLQPSYSYAIAGSQTTDVTVSNPQSFDGSLVEITVTVSSAAAPGPRTLVVTDPNDNRAVLSGAIEVE